MKEESTMKNTKKLFTILLLALVFVMMLAVPALADDGAAAAAATETAAKAWGAGIAIALAAAAGAIGMGIAIAKSAEAISRQPEASGEIRSAMMMGLVFIETAIIYALIAAILISMGKSKA